MEDHHRPAPGPRGTFAPADYDELVDCPLEAGRHLRRTFRVRGVPHRLAVYGGGNYDPDRLVKDLSRIVKTEAAMFGGLPTGTTPSSCTPPPTATAAGAPQLLDAPLPALRVPPRERYEGFLRLAAHEFFHLWNVKRIRPSALGPFDYEREVYTTLLWAMEGVTSYYDGLILVRSRLLTPAKYLRKLADKFKAFLEKPGRRHQSIAEASFDAWIKYYQPDEHSPNSTVSYYEKGEFVALGLDLEIRRRTRNRRSLDDVLRRLYAEVRRAGAGLPEERWREIAEEVAGGSLAAFWRDYVDGTREIDLGRFLEPAGLRVVREVEKQDGEVRPPAGAGSAPSSRSPATTSPSPPSARTPRRARRALRPRRDPRPGPDPRRRRDLGAPAPGLPGRRPLHPDRRPRRLPRELTLTVGLRDSLALRIAPRPRATPLQRASTGAGWAPPEARLIRALRSNIT